MQGSSSKRLLLKAVHISQKRFKSQRSSARYKAKVPPSTVTTSLAEMPAAAVTTTTGTEVDVVETLEAAVTLAAEEPEATAAGCAVAAATRAAGTVKVTTDSPATPQASQLLTTVTMGISG